VNDRKPIVLITGATATGKTALAITLAQESLTHGIESEIINADSLLFYKELSIGTAKPSLEEQEKIKHHLIGHQSVKSPLNASDFCEQALPLINDLHDKGKIPIIVGGSAFYVRALVKGMYDAGDIDPKASEKIQKLEEDQGWREVRRLLKEKDPISFERIHENDHYRTTRALEYFFTHNRPISGERQKVEEQGPYDFSRPRDPHWEIHHIYLEIPKDEHWPIMEGRVLKMLKAGLIDEVKSLLQQNINEEFKPLQSIGYKETLEFLVKGSKDEKELVEKIYINTRKLAKSQKTFFKKISPKKTYNPITEEKQIRQDFDQFLKKWEGR
jgi:tRNA dimethylallyltransferase